MFTFPKRGEFHRTCLASTSNQGSCCAWLCCSESTSGASVARLSSYPLCARFVSKNRYADATKKFIHPHVATVTYLSDAGAPTMVVHHQPMAFRGTESVRHAFISHPRLGKHMSFDGRLLHGVPPELIAPRTPSSYTRITVLVNVWLVRDV